MTQKDVTTVLYNKIEMAGNIEIKTHNNKDFHIFKSPIYEKYMVCLLNNEGESFHSDVFTSLDECYNWINTK